jgi:predicted RNA-binding Zn ribbon-like protein
MRYGTEAIALMNTDRPDASDALEDDQWLASALVDWEVVRSGPITRDDLEELRRLRAMLRRLTVVIASGRQLSNEELSDLNRLLARTPTFSHVEACDEGYILDMTPVAADWRDVAISEIVGSFAAMLRADPTRLRICARDGCGSVFWDETRSRTRSWCDSATCGNRVRVNRHRARRP